MCHNLTYSNDESPRDGEFMRDQPMRILVLGSDSPDLAAIENAFRLGEFEILAPGTAPLSPASPATTYSFAGWSLDALARDLVRLCRPARRSHLFRI